VEAGNVIFLDGTRLVLFFSVGEHEA